MAVTIKDVASLAGVSPSTVSRVCNDNPSISKETRERVRKAMAQLGYELSPASATAQESRAIRMVGIILPASQRETYDNSFYLEVIRGVSKYCNMHGAASMIITGRDDHEVLLALENVRASGQADGFILVYSKKNDPVVEYLVEHGLLYVLIGKPSQSETPTICIDNDNLLAGREATDYLYDLGHRRIAYLSS
ncbi:MAG: LacI family DNA-binding transcriptional regulator, partial [Christensenellales bacterium]|nr:LacI family DNA-binding transcriptional regulator [Christensenellales bacterium]